MACPKKIEIPGKAIEKLRALANRRVSPFPGTRRSRPSSKRPAGAFPGTDQSFLEKVGEVIEPYGPVKATVGFFVGCMYNLRQQQSALDAMEVLHRNGIRVIIPKEQVCCGSPLIRTGQLDDIDSLKRRNIQTFTSREIDTVLTMCAGCGSTLKHDYTTPFKVMDINEILTQYGIEPPANLGIKATYHDPCHLLRGQGIRDQPRELIRQVVDLVEMPSICCGSGGGVRCRCPGGGGSARQAPGRRDQKDRRRDRDHLLPVLRIPYRGHTDKPVKNVMTVLLEGYREKDRPAKKKK